MKGYFSNDALVVATESRTLLPIRIPRLPEALHHPQVDNLYPLRGRGRLWREGLSIPPWMEKPAIRLDSLPLLKSIYTFRFIYLVYDLYLKYIFHMHLLELSTSKYFATQSRGRYHAKLSEESILVSWPQWWKDQFCPGMITGYFIR